MEKTPAAPVQPISLEQFWAEHFAPAYELAQARERQWQEEAFADQPHTVCGFALRGMTPYDLLLLYGCENALVSGGRIQPEHLAQFLAVLVEPAPRGWWARRRFFRRVAALPWLEAVRECRAYVDRMFASSSLPPRPQSAAGAASAPEAAPLDMCFLAPLILSLAKETGWSESALLGMRLDKLFQYRRALVLMEEGRGSPAVRHEHQARALAAYNHYLATGQLPG